MFLVGLSQGPLHHYWYGFIDRALPSGRRTGLRTVGLKILADQIVAAPFFAVTFFYGMGLLQGKGLADCWTEFAAKFPAVYLVSSGSGRAVARHRNQEQAASAPLRLCESAWRGVTFVEVHKVPILV